MIFLSFTFILFTAIGTVAHECGHFLASEFFGDEATIHYKYCSHLCPHNHPHRHAIFFILGGPLQTVLTGTTGFFLLFVFRKSFDKAARLSVGQWILIFISLFWLRQTANFIIHLGAYVLTGKLHRRDEWAISRALHLSGWAIPAATALIGVVILAIIIFKFIPLSQRFTFVISGIIGGTLGYFCWLVWLGKYILP